MARYVNGLSVSAMQTSASGSRLKQRLETGLNDLVILNASGSIPLTSPPTPHTPD